MKFKEYFKIDTQLADIVKKITEDKVITDWVRKAVMRMLSKTEENALQNVIVHDQFTDAFKLDLEDTIHYLENIPENDKIKQLKGNYEQVNSNAKKWIKASQNKATSIVSKPEVGLEVVYDFKDGYKMVKLTNKDQCSREGTLMGHCIGGYDPGRVDLISLRDKDNNPHVTMEISHKGEVKQIKGKENRAPIEKYIKYVKEYLAKNPKFVVTGDGENLGYIQYNKKYYDPASDTWNKVYTQKVIPAQQKKYEELRSMIVDK